LLLAVNVFVWTVSWVKAGIYGDFAGYYALAHLGFHEGWSRYFDLAAQRRAWQWVGPTPWYPNMYPPFVAWLVGPLLLVPYPVAYATWVAVQAGALGA